MRRLGVLKSCAIRAKIPLLFAMIFLSASGIIVKSGLDERRRAIESAKNTSLMLLQKLALHQEQIENTTKEMLARLAQSQDVQRLDRNACSELFSNLKNRHPYYSVIGAITLDGNMIAASEPLEQGSINIIDQVHVRDALNTQNFSIGEYRQGKISGYHTIHFGYPITNANRKLVGVVTAGIRLDRYASIIKKSNLPSDSVVVITDRKGVRLHRMPVSNEAALGKPIPKDALERMSGNLDNGIFEGVSGDGKYRINAFNRFKLQSNLPPHLYMIVGMVKDNITHGADLMIFYSLLILAIAGFAIIVISWIFTGFIARPQ